MQEESVPYWKDRGPLFPGRSCYPLSYDNIDINNNIDNSSKNISKNIDKNISENINNNDDDNDNDDDNQNENQNNNQNNNQNDIDNPIEVNNDTSNDKKSKSKKQKNTHNTENTQNTTSFTTSNPKKETIISPRENRMDQLNIIFEIIGTPVEADIRYITDINTRNFLREKKPTPPMVREK